MMSDEPNGSIDYAALRLARIREQVATEQARGTETSDEAFLLSRLEQALCPPREGTQVSPHPFGRLGWRWWICRHCYAPKSLHPRRGWVKARPYGDTTYISADAPHFQEGW